MSQLVGCRSVQISSGLCQFFEARGQSKCLPSGERKGILFVGTWMESFEKTEVCGPYGPPIVAKAHVLTPVRAPCTRCHLREAFPGSPLSCLSTVTALLPALAFDGDVPPPCTFIYLLVCHPVDEHQWEQEAGLSRTVPGTQWVFGILFGIPA